MNAAQRGGPQSPADPSFWDSWYQDAHLPPGWHYLTAKERCVMAHADEEACLNQVIACFLGHERGSMWAYSNDTEAISALIPEFTAIVSAMLAQGILEIRELPTPASQWQDVPPLDPARAPAVLADPATWIERRRPGDRHVMITATYGRPKARLSGTGQPDHDGPPGDSSGSSE